MGTTPNKAQLIEQVRQARAQWVGLLGEVGVDHMEQPGAMGDWTFRDLLAHLNAWWQREVARLEAAQRGSAPEKEPGFDVEDFNLKVYKENMDRPVVELLDESRAVWDRLEHSLQALSEQDLTEPGRFAWMGGQALGPAVVRDFLAHLQEEHMPSLRHWLGNQTSL